MQIFAVQAHITTTKILIALCLLAAALVIAIRRRFATSTVVFFSRDTKYQAPYEPGAANIQHRLEFQQYEAILRPGYPLAEHQSFTGFLTDYHIGCSIKLPRWGDGMGYIGRYIDDDQLVAIRSDPGVVVVKRVEKIYLVR